MGVACPHLSDDTCYAMVDSTGSSNSCRCPCGHEYSTSSAEEEETSASSSSGCCSPQVFTSIMLGVLACVLMTGGVFLAFHRWDPLWLIVSAVGVVLVLIGSILHCCANSSKSNGAMQHPRRHSANGKVGCCGRSDHVHSGHLIANNGSLTEQLLPLSNARSVSQLSLNMLPGYFPPVVTTYGIEQHSAVVQNINRIVQQQQQQPQTPGSNGPGTAGKSFILLSLPGDPTTANIQNLVATVYQLDGSGMTEIPAADSSTIPTTSSATTTTPIIAPNPSHVLKNVQVQTCNMWPNTVPNPIPSVTNEILSTASTSVACGSSYGIESRRASTSTASGATQTENIDHLIPEAINLMDCSPDVSPVCDNSQSTSSGVVDIPTVLVDVTESPVQDSSPSALVSAVLEPSTGNLSIIDNPPNVSLGAVPEPSSNSLLDMPTDVLVEVVGSTAGSLIRTTSNDVLIDISEVTTEVVSGAGTSGTGPSEVFANIDIPATASDSNNLAENPAETNDNVQSEVPMNRLQTEIGSSELSLSISNLSDIDAEVDDNELMERSSPPPSYDDVALEGENAIGAFGLAYGTI